MQAWQHATRRRAATESTFGAVGRHDPRLAIPVTNPGQGPGKPGGSSHGRRREQRLFRAPRCDITYAAFGEGTREAQNQLQRLRGVHKHEVNGVHRPFISLRRYRLSCRAWDGITPVIEFFKVQRRQMQYARFRQQGLPIRSGTVETANTALVAQRRKCSGMRWSENGTKASSAFVPCHTGAYSV